jgi:ParB family chromosome partitioning protein
VQRRVAAGVLSAGHARALLALDDADAVEQLANRIVAEGLSVRNVEELILLGEADGRQRTPRTRSRRTRDPQVAGELAELTDVLADRLDTKVSADGFASSRSRGRLIVECADIADLRRVLEAMLAT